LVRLIARDAAEEALADQAGQRPTALATNFPATVKEKNHVADCRS
jgi:hypothetical protein